MNSKVLLIDDSCDIRRLVTAHLADEPIELICADSALHGLAAAREIRPDVILLDVELPDRDGFQVCRELKSDEATNQIAVIFLTAQSCVDEKIRGLDLGACDYVTKPFDSAELLARIRAALRTRRLTELLAHKARIDALTGLGNRAAFESFLEQMTSFSERHGVPLACIMADVDFFKRINDRHGHVCGDEVLRGIAGVLLTRCRTEDVVCRYGGEEFTILAPATEIDDAGRLAERLRTGIEELDIRFRGRPIKVTSSFGVCAWSAEDAANQLVESADAALLDAKRLGRNCVVVRARTSRPAGTHPSGSRISG